LTEIISNWKEVVELTEKKEPDTFEKFAVPPGEIFIQNTTNVGV